MGSAPTPLTQAPVAAHPKYFVIGSCAPFEAKGNLAKLLGAKTAARLMERGARGDFLYTFFDRRGRIVEAPEVADRSVLSGEQLRTLAARDDARVVLVAGGTDKLRTMTAALEAQVCNVVLTDTKTAQLLLRGKTEGV